MNEQAAANLIGNLFDAQDISGVNESLEQLDMLDLGNRDIREIAGKEIGAAKERLLSADASPKAVDQIPFVQLLAKTAQLEALQRLMVDPADKQQVEEILTAYRRRLPPGNHPRLESAIKEIKNIAAYWGQP